MSLFYKSICNRIFCSFRNAAHFHNTRTAICGPTVHSLLNQSASVAPEKIQPFAKQSSRSHTTIFAPTMEAWDKLQPIAPEKWMQLRDRLKQDWPEHEVAHNTVQNYINWNSINPHMEGLAILGLNDSWLANGTFILLDKPYMFIYTLDNSWISLKWSLHLVDWDYGWKIMHVRENHRIILDEVLKYRGIKLQLNVPSTFYYLSKEEAMNLELKVPADLYIGPLQQQHAMIANSAWSYRSEDSERLLNRLVAWNPSVGLFDSTGELLAWAFSKPTGAIGVVQVAENHRGKGYGTIVAKAICKEVAARGMNCYGSIVDGNDLPIHLFQKLGFKSIDRVFFYITEAKKQVEVKSRL